jgi:hypothetical protein
MELKLQIARYRFRIEPSDRMPGNEFACWYTAAKDQNDMAVCCGQRCYASP